jgi:Fe-S-cluster containining protein
VERLHGAVDGLVAPLLAEHAARLQCRAGCSDCCEDGLSVFSIEASVIERHHAELLAHGTPNDAGGCAFLDSGGHCRVYAHRPYVCRTQGLPLRWLEDDENEVVESRDICPKNAEGTALEELTAGSCWSIGPFERRLAERQASCDGDQGHRVALRSLFARANLRLPVVP